MKVYFPELAYEDVNIGFALLMTVFSILSFLELEFFFLFLAFISRTIFITLVG